MVVQTIVKSTINITITITTITQRELQKGEVAKSEGAKQI